MLLSTCSRNDSILVAKSIRICVNSRYRSVRRFSVQFVSLDWIIQFSETKVCTNKWLFEKNSSIFFLIAILLSCGFSLMLSTNVDDLAPEDGARPLLAVTATTGGTSYKPLGFRQLILTVRFVICLRKTRSPPSVNQPSRTSSSRSYTAVEVHSDDKEDEREIKKQDLKLIVKRMDFEALEQFGGVEAAVSFMRSEPQVTFVHAMNLLLENL